jgi:hypothetical protein
VYRRVARESPCGEGSLAMLERILDWWSGKILVLVLLGFAATDFMITMTLSAADASTHLLENSYTPHFLHGRQFVVTLVLLAALAAVFLRGFSEAIGIAVVLVERPDGLKIAACFIASFLIVSLVSRVLRSYELRATGVTFDETAAGFLRAAVPAGVINVIANEPDERDQQEYLAKWQEESEVNRIPRDQPTVFLEVSVADASEFEADLEIRARSGSAIRC